MKLGKTTVKGGQSWITIRDETGSDYLVIHIHSEVEEVELKGNVIEVKLKGKV